MSRRAAWVGLAAVAAVVLGCGPGKELPDDIKIGEPGEKAITIPGASEPAAKEYVEKALKAFTGGKPERAAKAKVSRVVLKGTMLQPVENQNVPVGTVRTIAAVWPDRFHGTNEHTVQGNTVAVNAWQRRPQLTVMSGAQELVPPNRAEVERVFTTDNTAQYWMALFQPLTDPKGVVFDLQSTEALSPSSGQMQAVRVLKLSLPDSPLFQLTFDAKSDLLLRVDYTVTQGVRRRVQWAAVEHKPGPDGLQLPSKTECRHDGVLIEKWDVDKWEFPEKIDDAEFLPPKADTNPPKK